LIKKIIIRFGLILLGIFLSLVLVEGALRLSGFIYQFNQQRHNRIKYELDSDYKIICIGESTTALGGSIHSYPAQLEQVLNDKQNKLKFTVINKGICGTNSSYLVASVGEIIDEYKPDMVISMMGINDICDPITRENVSLSLKNGFLNNMRIYKLIKLIFARIKDSYKKDKFIDLELSSFSEDVNYMLTQEKKSSFTDKDNDIPNEEESYYLDLGFEYYESDDFINSIKMFQKASNISPENDKIYVYLAEAYREILDFENVFKVLGKALSLNPYNDDAYIELGWSIAQLGNIQKSFEMFKKAFQINPENDEACIMLGYYCLKKNDKENADIFFKKAKELTFGTDEAYVKIADMYIELGDYDNAVVMLEKALSINSNNPNSYIELGKIFLNGDYKKAASLFKQAIQIDPKNDEAFQGLGWTYRKLGKLNMAENCFLKAIVHNPYSAHSYYSLATIYVLLDEISLAEEMYLKSINLSTSEPYFIVELAEFYLSKEEYSKAEKLLKDMINSGKSNGKIKSLYEFAKNGSLSDVESLPISFNTEVNSDFPDITEYNYNKLYELLKKKNIKLVVVQYPMRNIWPLKMMFEDKEVLFVDNEKPFKDVVKKDGYWQYFNDIFGGNFGHCTEKGNRLLAENIADVVIRYFNRE